MISFNFIQNKICSIPLKKILESMYKRISISHVWDKLKIKQERIIMQCSIGLELIKHLSGWRDLNSRPLRPERSALTGLRYTPLYSCKSFLFEIIAYKNIVFSSDKKIKHL